MEEQLINNCILDQFINSHEQSYEEFLSTFTYLLKGMYIPNLPLEIAAWKDGKKCSSSI